MRDWLWMLAAAGMSLTANAADLAVCARLTDDAQRLACYDAAVRLEAAATAEQPARHVEKEPQDPPPAPAAVTVQAPPAVEQASAAEFGMETKQVEKRQLDALQARVQKVRKDPYGRLIVTLDNGQVWRQSESGSYPLADGDRITIERGFLSAFYLQVDGLNRRIKVQRSK